MELNCKHNRNPSIKRLIDHAQPHVTEVNGVWNF